MAFEGKIAPDFRVNKNLILNVLLGKYFQNLKKGSEKQHTSILTLSTRKRPAEAPPIRYTHF